MPLLTGGPFGYDGSIQATKQNNAINRRRFLKGVAAGAGVYLAGPAGSVAAEPPSTRTETRLSVADLPRGKAPSPLAFSHFPDRLHAFVWRNWTLVPLDRMARVAGATRVELLKVGRSMGLPKPPRITREQQRRSYITVLKRNWHLLPYNQLLDLLAWTPEQMAYTLREDDFLYEKLGSLKPQCVPLRYSPPTESTQRRAQAIASTLAAEFPEGLTIQEEPHFGFVEQLSTRPPAVSPIRATPGRFTPRFCYSYFALYGDPLLEPEIDPYPEGYLARLARSGVDGVWLQAVLYKLAPFPWDVARSARYEERLKNLRRLIARARRHGIGVYLYLNEPRAMPLRFFAQHPQLRGVTEGDHAALCTSHPEVENYLTESTASICRAAPDLAGFFTITASENLTNCWSHGGGGSCARCGPRSAAAVIAGVNRQIQKGIDKAGTATRLLCWDWGWDSGWAPRAIDLLPAQASLMSVSEWSLPIERGGVKTEVGEYSISAVGPGPRATRHWQIARKRGLKTIAKIQAGNSWELSAVPYIPALQNVARHAANLRQAKVDGLMLGWTLGGYPSPNLEVVAEIAGSDSISPEEATRRVAERRFGSAMAPAVVQAWQGFSDAFSEFPYHGGVLYQAPLQVGPANLLWAERTGYSATMVGFPYDDLDSWRAVYPVDVFIAQFRKIDLGFRSALDELRKAAQTLAASPAQRRALAQELDVAEAAALHFRSVANQAQFVRDRNRAALELEARAAVNLKSALRETVRDELELAKRLFRIQSRDSRIGFEASNQYFYVPMDLLEKMLNCHDLLHRWLR